ncbi:MAG: hypothetical protein P8L85_00385 [Rubripirellula sp.]|nr:hypothetical protein [Rubripirellula sp.]
MFWLLRKFIGFSCFLSFLVVALAGYVYVRDIQNPVVGPQTPVGIREAVDQACQRLVDALPNPEVALRPTLILTMEGDRQSLVTDSMSRWLSEDGRYRSVDPGLLDQLYEKVGFDRRAVSDREDAVRLARAMEAEVVIFGRINRLEIDQADVNLSLDIQVLDLVNERELYADVLTNLPVTEVRDPGTPVSGNTYVLPFFALVCLTLAWPIACFPGVRALLRIEHNGLTAACLLLIIAVPIFVWWSAVSLIASGVVAVLLLVIGTIAIPVWCLFVTNSLAAPE